MAYVAAFFLIVFILAFFLIRMLAKKALPKVTAYKDKLDFEAEVKKNPYVQYHQFAKVDNDRYYTGYLKWCEINEQIPMNKESFLTDVENKEQYLNNIIDNLIK